MAALEAGIKREEQLLAAEGLAERGVELEALARKALVRDSARVRVGLSRRVVETLARLDDPSLKPKEVAQTLLALKAVAAGIYPWDEEPSLEEMKHADSPLAKAIDLEFIAKTPRGCVWSMR